MDKFSQAYETLKSLSPEQVTELKGIYSATPSRNVLEQKPEDLITQYKNLFDLLENIKSRA